MGPIASLAQLVEAARGLAGAGRGRAPRRLVVAAAETDSALAAAAEARRQGIAEVVLVGGAAGIRERLARLGEDASAFTIEPADDDAAAARRAVALVRAGEGAVILKGRIATAELLRAVLHRTEGLRTGQLLSDVLVADHPLAPAPRLLGVTDGGVNVAPTLEQKKAIVRNAAAAFRALGVPRPRVACLCAAEVASDAMPHTRDAEALARACAEGELGACQVSGPLALDNALSPEAAHAKGIEDPVAGHADLILAPTIEAGNALGKAFTYLARKPVAHVILGARAPVLIPSRVESAADKLCSIALGVLAAAAEAAP